MNAGNDYKGHAILFVDDEDKARKYFGRAFGQELTVYTAASVEEAKQILARAGDEIAVLVTDQRMPGQNGVELLKYAREQFPDVVRLLTTAYSELRDAIDAVNRGEIYRYITKPWDVDALQAEVRQALEYHRLRRERELLVREKLTVWQRLVLANRVRDLLVLAGGLGYLRHSLQAVRALLRQSDALNQAPAILDWRRLDLWSLTQSEVERMLEVARRISAATGCDTGLADPVDLAAIEAPALEIKGPLPNLRGNRQLMERMLHLLCARLGEPAPRLVAGPATDCCRPAIELRAIAAGPWDPAAGLLSAPGERDGSEGLLADLLAVFLIAYHHGGEVSIEPGRPGSPQLRIVIPADPEAGTAPELDPFWLEDLLAHCEPGE